MITQGVVKSDQTREKRAAGEAVCLCAADIFIK